MRKSAMRRRLGELEQQLSGARARERDLQDAAVVRDLQVADLENRIRLGIVGIDSALGQLNPLTQAAQQFAVVRLALQPERRSRGSQPTPTNEPDHHLYRAVRIADGRVAGPWMPGERAQISDHNEWREEISGPGGWKPVVTPPKEAP